MVSHALVIVPVSTHIPLKAVNVVVLMALRNRKDNGQNLYTIPFKSYVFTKRSNMWLLDYCGRMLGKQPDDKKVIDTAAIINHHNLTTDEIKEGAKYLIALHRSVLGSAGFNEGSDSAKTQILLTSIVLNAMYEKIFVNNPGFDPIHMGI